MITEYICIKDKMEKKERLKECRLAPSVGKMVGLTSAVWLHTTSLLIMDTPCHPPFCYTM